MLLSRTSWNAARWCFGGKIRLGAREVEADDAAALVGHSGARAISYDDSGEMLRMPQNDDVGLDAVGLPRAAQTLEHGLDDSRELEAEPRVQHRRVAHLHVTDVLEVRVFGQLEGDALERLFGLHHAQGDVETAEILDERAELVPAADGLS